MKESPTEYLKERGMHSVKYFDGSDARVIYKGDIEIGRYTGYEATHYGMRNVTPEIALEEYIKPIVEKWMDNNSI